MTNARILLMRHAEKTGDPLDPHLSADGYARAAKLAHFIPAMFGRPTFLIAASVSKHSTRCIETINPLVAKASEAEKQWSATDVCSDAVSGHSIKSHCANLRLICPL